MDSMVAILPVVIIRGFTTLYPIIVTLKNSLFDVKVLSGVNKNLFGLANYVNVFKDPKVQTSARHPADELTLEQAQGSLNTFAAGQDDRRRRASSGQRPRPRCS